MKKVLYLGIIFLVFMLFASVSFGADFNGQADYQFDSLGYYYAITGGKFPNGQTVNGDNASGGTFRWIHDDPAWGHPPINEWHKDDWFPENAGLALTMKYQGSTIFDNFNNDTGDFYTTPEGQASAATPGLYRGYCMSNNWDWIYAGYFKLAEETNIDEIIGYFDETYGLDRNSPHISYRMNIWSDTQDGNLLPAVNSFSGDVFCSDFSLGKFSWGDTGVNRIYGEDRGYQTDDILYLAFHLENPITLPAGEYWFSHDAIVDPIVVTPNPVAVNTDVSLSAVVSVVYTDEDSDVIDKAWYTLDGGINFCPMDIITNPGYDALATATFQVFDAGVYNLCAFAEDTTGNIGPEVCTLLVVYDPNAGFVTGGGWIRSPEEAFASDPSLTGKATFGFVSKYKKGATIPTGNTEFVFDAAGLDFHSTSYDWLVVTGGNYAKFKGTGTINDMQAPNAEDYKFMVWAGDGDTDTFRIKIWYEENDSEIVVYDNGMDQPIGGGSIIVHDGKKK